MPFYSPAIFLLFLVRFNHIKAHVILIESISSLFFFQIKQFSPLTSSIEHFWSERKKNSLNNIDQSSFLLLFIKTIMYYTMKDKKTLIKMNTNVWKMSWCNRCSNVDNKHVNIMCYYFLTLTNYREWRWIHVYTYSISSLYMCISQSSRSLH